MSTNCWHTDWCQEWNIKTSLLKTVKSIHHKPCFPMRMFLSVSGPSSELSIANHGSRPTLSDTISSLFENHQPQKTKISTVIYAPFIQNSNQMASRLTATTSFPRVLFSTAVISAFWLTGLLRWQKLTWFSSIFFRICRFRSLILLFAVSFHSTRSDVRVRFDSGVIFFEQSRFFATHNNQWNCFILYRS